MTQRSSTEIAAELAEFRAARAALIKGERVEEVSDDASRMKIASLSLSDLVAAIRDLEREYTQAVSVEEGRPARTAIGTGYC